MPRPRSPATAPRRSWRRIASSPAAAPAPGAVGTDPGEPEGEEVVGDPVDPPAGAARVLGDRNEAIDQAEPGEALQHPRRGGPDGVGDLVVLRAAGGARIQDPGGE